MAFTSVTSSCARSCHAATRPSLLSDTFCTAAARGRHSNSDAAINRYFFIPSFFTDYSLPHGFNAAGHPAPHGRTHAKGGNPPMQADPDGPAGKNPGDGEVKQKRSTAVAGLSYRPG